MAGSTDITLHWVQSLEEALAFKRWLGERRPYLAVDTETGGFDWWVDPLRTVQFGDRHTGWCIEHSMWKGLIVEALRDYDGPITMHNAKFDTHFLEHNGIPIKRWLVHDSRAMAHIIDPASPSALKTRAAKVLGRWALHGQDALKLAMMNGGWGWGDIPIELLWKYAAFDTCLTAQITEEMEPEIRGRWSEIYGLELASTQVLTDMERRGMPIDRRYLTGAREEWGLEQAAIDHELKERWLVANPNSTQQLAARMSQDGVRFIVFTEKTNQPVMTEDILSAIDHPIAKLATRHAELKMMRDTFARNILELASDNDVLHPSINPLGARTGRMSVSRPSMQNMPAKDPRIRDGFPAWPGETLIPADYDQVEMRLFAHFSQDKNMLAAIRYGDQMAADGHEGYDLHSMNARMVWQIAMGDAVPSQLRKRVKSVGFSKVYGSGVAKFSAQAGLSMEEGAAVLQQYDAAFPGVREFQSTITQTLWKRSRQGDAHLVTAYGRKEPCDPQVAYKGVNYLVQGTAADVLKDRIVALSKTWVGQHMLMPIHDEILFSVPDDAVQDALAVIREVMPVRDRFAVPLTIDASATNKSGQPLKRWGDKYRIEPKLAQPLENV